MILEMREVNINFQRINVRLMCYNKRNMHASAITNKQRILRLLCEFVSERLYLSSAFTLWAILHQNFSWPT